MRRQKTAAHYCNVRHRPGTTAEAMCPVHGRGYRLFIPAGLDEQFFSGQPMSNAAKREFESDVPGFDPSHFDGENWVNKEGMRHRLDGPTGFFSDGGYGDEPEFLNSEWHIDGRRVSRRQVLARYINAMSDGQIPAHDLSTIRHIADVGVDVDPVTFKFTLNNKFDAAVQEYVDDHIGPRARYRRLSDDQVNRIPPDPDDSDGSYEWIRGDWSRHRPFGKAIETTNSDIAQYWWDGSSVGRDSLIAKSLIEASGGKMAPNNWAAIGWVSERIQVDDNGGGLYLPAYRNASWEEIAEALLRQFPNPGPNDEYVRYHRNDYGEVDFLEWGKGKAAHRTDGPAVVNFSHDGSQYLTYALDGKKCGMETVMARYVSEKCGVEIADNNHAAIEYIESLGVLSEGDESNDWAFVADDSLPNVAAIAVSLHENPA